MPLRALQELLSLLGHEVEAIGASVYTEEARLGQRIDVSMRYVDMHGVLLHVRMHLNPCMYVYVRLPDCLLTYLHRCHMLFSSIHITLWHVYIYKGLGQGCPRPETLPMVTMM